MYRPNNFLRTVLLADAVASGATGVLMLGGAGLLENLLGLPAALTREAGAILVPYVAFVAFIATRDTIPRSAVQVAIVCNVMWAAASVLLLVTDYVAPTALGYAFVIAQAAVVAAFAELQIIGLRRPDAVTA